MGCMLSKKISSLQLEIGGTISSPKRVKKKTSSRRNDKGRPNELTLILGDNMTISINGNGLFSNKNFTSDRLSNYSIADISRFELIKDGIKYSHKNRKCEKKRRVFWDWGKKVCKHDIYEENIWSLNELRIKVNGQLIYNKGGIGKKIYWPIFCLAR